MTVQVRYSNDGCNNWSAWRDFPEAATGAFLAPLVVRRLGMARQRIWELRDTGERAIDLLSASLYVESE